MACVTCDDNFTLARGERRPLYLTIMETEAEDSPPLNLTDYTVLLFVGDADDTDAVSIISKSTEVAEEGDILTAADGTVAFYFVPADTLDLDPGTYNYEVWLYKSPSVDERLTVRVLNIDKRRRPVT